MCPESPIYQKQQLPGSESVSFCISALMGGSECSFLSVGHTPSRRKSVGKCPKTARARSAYLTDPLHHGALSCNAPAEHLSIRGKLQQEPLKLAAGERGSTEAGICRRTTHFWPGMLWPDQGPVSRAWPRATETERPLLATAPQTRRLPSTKLSPHRSAPRAHPRSSPSSSAPWR